MYAHICISPPTQKTPLDKFIAAPKAAPVKEETPEEIAARQAIEQLRIAEEAAKMEAARLEAEEAARKAAEEEARRLAEEEAKKSKEQKDVERIIKVLQDKKATAEAKQAALKEVADFVKGAESRAYEAFVVKMILPVLLDVFDDKAAPVRNAADTVGQAIIASICPHATYTVVHILFQGLSNDAKWRTKQASLNLLIALTLVAPLQISACLPDIIPVVVGTMWDTKAEVKSAAKDALHKVCSVVSNRDIVPFLPALESAMVAIDEVPECIQSLASTTFVQTVDGASLSVIVPLLSRGFSEKKTAIKRQCAVIVSNMSKLVEDPVEAAPFLPELLPALQRAADEISDPEARAVASRAHDQLEKIKASAQHGLKMRSEQPTALLNAIHSAIGKDLTEPMKAALEYVSLLCGSLVNSHAFNQDTVAKFIRPFFDAALHNEDAAKAACESLLSQWGKYEADNQEEEEVEDGEELCNCKFTLAYGSKVLLHNTELRLLRGKRYGLLGGNDSGKSTLLRAIANHQIDGFPPESELRTVLVEADIQGEMSHLACLDYVFEDERIKHCGAPREEVARVMSSVGFTEKMLRDPITSLSGGWRMKLALARAMLQNADILLLDEPTNHLDVINVAWVQSYLNSLTDVTSIIVSHDSGLLDKCCTHILQIDNLKLHLHKGNLSEFVKKVPSAMSFFSLKESKFKFKFPQPGYLEGVKSKGKALMKMESISYTYPGNDKPTISEVTVQVSLSSFVTLSSLCVWVCMWVNKVAWEWMDALHSN